MEIIELNDKTQLEGHIVPNGDDMVIFVYLNGMSLAEGFSIFSDRHNISVLKATDHGTETVYRGFTEITAINTDFGNCNITLRKG